MAPRRQPSPSMIILAGLAALGSSLGPIPSRSRLIRRATAATTVQPELRDYAGAASALFGTYRVPGALFAGASAGAAFAMPLDDVADTFKLALCARRRPDKHTRTVVTVVRGRQARLRVPDGQLPDDADAGEPFTHSGSRGIAVILGRLDLDGGHRRAREPLRRGAVARRVPAPELRARVRRDAAELLRRTDLVPRRARREGVDLHRVPRRREGRAARELLRRAPGPRLRHARRRQPPQDVPRPGLAPPRRRPARRVPRRAHLRGSGPAAPPGHRRAHDVGRRRLDARRPRRRSRSSSRAS